MASINVNPKPQTKAIAPGVQVNEMSDKRTPITAHDKRSIAVRALCDGRSVEKYLRGGEMRQMLRLRIEEALRELGLKHAIRSEAA